MEFNLYHPCGVHVCRTLTQASLAGAELKHQDMGTGWVWIQLPSFQDGEVLVGLSLGFNGGKLEMVRCTDGHSKYGKSWNDWSEKQEHLRAQSIGTWLASKGYPAGEYSWGSVWWGYDAKGGFGSAVVRCAA